MPAARSRSPARACAWTAPRQLDMLALDDSQTRLQLDQGRIDIKTFTSTPSSPTRSSRRAARSRCSSRATITSRRARPRIRRGSACAPGAAQIQSLNGQVLAVRAGEVGEISGDGSAPQLRTIKTAPPPHAGLLGRARPPGRLRQPPQYLSAGVTGYEDLNAYGSWSNDPEYGQRLDAARRCRAGWAPYSTGHWTYVQPWGWTWVDEQPWGFAPYHYGRWANRNNRWVWVPPQRERAPVYAPALVAFVGGIELARRRSASQSRAPVGWFPLGPREAYVPSYTTNRDYYRRLNRSGPRRRQQVLEDRWQRAAAARGVSWPARTALMNQRFATVVPADGLRHARSRCSARPCRCRRSTIAAAPVAPVAAPPAPTASVAQQRRPRHRPRRKRADDAAAEAPHDPHAAAPAPAADPKAEARCQGEGRSRAEGARQSCRSPGRPSPTCRPWPSPTDDGRSPPRPARRSRRHASRQGCSTATSRDRPRRTLAPRQGAAPPPLQRRPSTPAAAPPAPASRRQAAGRSDRQRRRPQPQRQARCRQAGDAARRAQPSADAAANRAEPPTPQPPKPRGQPPQPRATPRRSRRSRRRRADSAAAAGDAAAAAADRPKPRRAAAARPQRRRPRLQPPPQAAAAARQAGAARSSSRTAAPPAPGRRAHRRRRSSRPPRRRNAAAAAAPQQPPHRRTQRQQPLRRRSPGARPGAAAAGASAAGRRNSRPTAAGATARSRGAPIRSRAATARPQPIRRPREPTISSSGLQNLVAQRAFSSRHRRSRFSIRMSMTLSS